MKRGEIQLAAVGAWEYSDMDISAVMEPVFVHVEQDRALKEYLLLTRRDSGLNTLRSLRGKDIVLLENTVSLLSLPWLEVLLAEENLGTKETFFRKAEVVQKPSAAVLPVFFGTRQACVTDRPAYQILTEMNPQVSASLQVVATSQPYVSSIICMSKNGWPSEESKNDFRTALKDLHQDPDGHQILMLFKVERFEPFKEVYLKSLKELRAKHQRLLLKPKP